MANNDKENKIEKFTKEAIGKTLNQFNKEIGVADLVEINKNQDRILNGILSQINDESTEKTEKSNIITLDNSTDGIVELKEIQGDTNVNVSKIEEMPITHDIGDKEGNVFTLNEITKGAISIGEIQGNTMVNCNKDDKKELVLMKDLSTQGDNNITLTEGVDGGLVDVALEGNTLVNVSKTKDSTAITKAYTVENSGNHVALQGEYDGNCRPVITGNTLVNLFKGFYSENFTIDGDNYTATRDETTSGYANLPMNLIYELTNGKTYTAIIDIKTNTLDGAFYIGGTDRVGFTSNVPINTTGVYKYVFTYDSSAIDKPSTFYVGFNGNKVKGTLSINKNIIILEGDYTDKPIPDYFEGLQSSFEDRLVPENIIDFNSLGVGNISNSIITANLNPYQVALSQVIYNVAGKTLTLKCGLNKYSWIRIANESDTNQANDIAQMVSSNSNIVVFTVPNNVSSIQLRLQARGEGGECVFENPILVEGDYTNYDFSDYDPTKAGKYKVDYKVTGKNKFDLSNLQVPNGGNCTINNNSIRYYATIDELSSYNGYNSFDIEVKLKPNTIYSFKCDSNVTAGDIPSVCGGIYIFINGVHTYSVPDTTKPQKIETDKTGIVSFKFIGNWTETKHDFDVTFSNIQLEEGDTLTSYEPYKEATKTLYLNSPLLERDTIEQYGNNIVHVHRYGKVVLDGGVSPWGNKWWESTSNTTDTVFSGGLSSAPYEDIGYCDKLLIVTPSNLSSYDTAITIDGESIIRINIPKTLLSGNKDLPAFRVWLTNNPITFVGKLKTPQYEVIEQSNLVIDSYTNGHLDLSSAVPVSKVNFLHFEEELTYLYPSTSYTVQFMSDKAITVDITLGGTQLLAKNIIKGLNRIAITTPATLVDNKLVIDGVGANISDVVVTDTDREFMYFEGMKSVGECEELEVKSINKNLYNFDWTIINTKNDYGTSNGYFGTIQKLKPNTKYYITVKNDNNIVFDDNYAYAYISGGMYGIIWTVKPNDNIYGNSSGEIITDNTGFVYFRASNKGLDFLNKLNQLTFQIEEGKVATDYIPHQSNAQTLTHEPLRAVGDIKDRYVLIDGKWYIERNCAEVVLDGSDKYYWMQGGEGDTNNGFTIYSRLEGLLQNSGISSDIKVLKGVEITTSSTNFLYCNDNTVVINIAGKTSINEVKSYISSNPITLIHGLTSPTYEPIDYNPFEVYSDVTHISTNSTIPTNITIKNHGFNCLLKPSTTYTISSNLGLNTVTTGADIGDSCLRFYDEDTSTKTTMRNVLILEGDWTSKTNLMPANFSGMESTFEQELVTDENDEHFGKYRVNAKVVGKNLLGTKVEAFLGRPYGNDIYAFQQHPNADAVSYIIPCLPNTTYSLSSLGDRNVMAEFNHYPINGDIVTNVYGRTITTSNTAKWLVVYINSLWTNDDLHAQLEYGDTATEYEPYKENNITFYLNEPLRGVENSKDRVFIQGDKVVVQRKCCNLILDGSDDENWNWDNGRYAMIQKQYLPNPHIPNSKLVCNTIPNYPNIDFSITNTIGIRTGNNYTIMLGGFKDLNSTKQWLQQNPTTVVYQLKEPVYEEVEYSSNRLILDTFNNESFNNSTLFLDTTILPKLSFKPLYEELVYVKNSTKYYIQFNAVGSGEVVINLGGTELTTEIVEGYNCIPITTPSESTNLMTISGQGITISEVVVSEVVCGGYYKGIQSCFEEHMENGKYRVLLRGIALDGSKVNGIKLYINEPLRGVGDTKDRLCIKNGKLMVERNYSSVILDGTGDVNDVTSWGASSDKTIEFRLGYNQFENKKGDILCDNFISETSNLWTMDTEGIQSYTADTVDIRINKTKLSTQDKTGFIQWLQQNPTTVVYQLKEPIYEEATNEYGLPIVFEGYENGIVYIDSAVTPTTHIKYTSNNQLATTLSEAEEQNIATQEDINMNVVTYMMDIDMILTEMEMSNDTSVMAVRRDSSNENMLDRMSEEDKKVYRDNTVVMLEKMITANVLEKEDIEGRINMYYNKNRISKEQYEYLKSLL